MVGFGSGGAVATFYVSHFASPSPRSLLLLNSYSYVDSYLAGVLHDCMNVFNCAPESRPDLPVYFHARFLFSPAYLGQVNAVYMAGLVLIRLQGVDADGGREIGCGWRGKSLVTETWAGERGGAGTHGDGVSLSRRDVLPHTLAPPMRSVEGFHQTTAPFTTPLILVFPGERGGSGYDALNR